MIRLGLCCLFKKEPIRFYATTAKNLQKSPRDKQLAQISDLCLKNCRSLLAALEFVHRHDIGAFRVPSPLFPRFTHPEVGYRLDELQDKQAILQTLGMIKNYGRQKNIRLSLHPDQFNVLSSPRANVVENSLKELEYQGEIAELIGAEVINIHGGGSYNSKDSALQRLRHSFRRLSPRVRQRLSLENDDRIYTVRDLLPVCRQLGIPLVYDVHHHRCNPDGLTIEEATSDTVKLWQQLGREPYFHLSSPREGWRHGSPRPHADYIDPADFPANWKAITATVDIEAKAKELAVLRIKRDLADG